MFRRTALSAAVAALFVAVLPFAAAAAPATKAPGAATLAWQPKALSWEPRIAYRSATLRVTGPGGLVHDRDFGTGKPVFDLASLPYLADGRYTYELRLGRQPDAALAKAMAAAEPAEDGTFADRSLADRIGALAETVTGTFLVEGGRIVSPYLVEPRTRDKDIIQADDVIAQSSLCVGFGCVDGESFGFTTIKLKEDNTRITFDDTSSTAGFPANDWELTANDSLSGGANRFSITDVTGNLTPFTVTAGAPNNSLFIASTGRLGLRTAAPVLDIHAITGNTPALRLEQDTTSGWSAQTWDIGANESNFFVRDVTAGSHLPFRIRPGAPTSSADILASGVVDFGTHLKLYPGAAQPAAINATHATVRGSTAGNLVLNGSTVGHVYVNNDAGINTFILGSGNLGIGTTAPRQKVSIGDYLDLYTGAASATPVAASIRGSASGNLVLNGASNGNVFINNDAGWNTLIMGSGNVGIGTASPTAKLHVEGDALVAGSLHVTGACCGPDYVFDASYKLASIDDQAAYMRENRHLPAVGAARTTAEGKGVVDVFKLSNGMLEELEKAHLYIGELHREIGRLKDEAVRREAAIREELAAIRALLAR